MKLLPFSDTEGMPRLPKTEAIAVVYLRIDEELAAMARHVYMAVMGFYHRVPGIMRTAPMPEGLAGALLSLWQALQARNTLAIRECLDATLDIIGGTMLPVDATVNDACQKARETLKALKVEV